MPSCDHSAPRTSPPHSSSLTPDLKEKQQCALSSTSPTSPGTATFPAASNSPKKSPSTARAASGRFSPRPVRAGDAIRHGGPISRRTRMRKRSAKRSRNRGTLTLYVLSVTEARDYPTAILNIGAPGHGRPSRNHSPQPPPCPPRRRQARRNNPTPIPTRHHRREESVTEFPIWIPGTPVPQGSKSVTRTGVMFESNPRLKPWRETMSHALTAWTGTWFGAWEPFDGPLFVD